jgi:phosphoribosylaminoimidazolecarboxamide formyltransferase / IMP cyclohydrolase
MRTAILSVSNKKGLVKFADFLYDKNVKIISTGGTFNLLYKECKYNSHISSVSSTTQFPEILGGRVKTLHPNIHGGILAKRHELSHMEELESHSIAPIDLVVANLYPFEEIVTNSSSTHNEALENIDIGGHTLIRASAKNYKDVLVATTPSDYELIMENWDKLSSEGNGDSLRNMLARRAWDHIVKYDMAISKYFQGYTNESNEIIYKRYEKVSDLKYGLNPQQGSAGIYSSSTKNNSEHPFEILNGDIGYINVLDAIYGWNLVKELQNEFKEPSCSCASYKHNSPAGVAIGGSNLFELTQLEKKMFLIDESSELSPAAEAFIRARNVDPMCSFGDFIAISGTVDVQTAKLIASEVSDGIIASNYKTEALEILKKKKKGAYVVLKGSMSKSVDDGELEIREMHGVILSQESNSSLTKMDDLNFSAGTDGEFLNIDLLHKAKINGVLANTTLKFSQSNSVASTAGGQVLGVGAGQQSRVDCVNLVKRKTENWILRKHPKCLELAESFADEVKRTDKINIIMDYIKGTLILSDDVKSKFVNYFHLNPLTEEDKKDFLEKYYESVYNEQIVLASDGFIPFRDNIDLSATFGVKYIVQPGGSVADDQIKKACDEYGIKMALTGREMRMFLH